MKELCCSFGDGGHLAGIITEPRDAHGDTLVVLVNAGLVPKHGPYRLYALLARRLAQEGIRTLRFDLGDIGDSQPAHVGMALEQRTQLEIGAAVQMVCERFSPRRVVLGGLCSGAEDSYRYAATDPRISGVIMIDPFAYPTAGWRWRDALYRIVRRSLLTLGLRRPGDHTFVRLFRKALAQPEGRVASSGALAIRPESSGPAHLNYRHMAHAQASGILTSLVARGTRLHFIYTGGARPRFNHAGQLAAMFQELDFRDRVSLDYFPHLEHMQPLHSERLTLIEAISKFLAQLRATSGAMPSVLVAPDLQRPTQSSAM